MEKAHVEQLQVGHIKVLLLISSAMVLVASASFALEFSFPRALRAKRAYRGGHTRRAWNRCDV